MAQSSATSHWICQVCHRPAPDGIIEIINTNIDLGPIGSYPVERTRDVAAVEKEYLHDLRRKKGIGDQEPASFRLDEVLGIPRPERNIGFVVRHLGCTADKEVQGYWFNAAEASTLEAYAGWILHLGEKTWMGREDFLAMLSFWWTHKGAQPPR